MVFAVVTVVAVLLLAVATYVVSSRSPHTDDATLHANYISMAPEVAGRIHRLLVKNDQRVVAGELLFEIDPAPYQLALEQARAGTEVVRAQIGAAGKEIGAAGYGVDATKATIGIFQAQLDLANGTLKRLRPLVEQGYATEEALDAALSAQRQALAGLIAAKATHQQAKEAVPDLRTLRATLRASEVAEAQAELQLSRTLIHAPFTGKIVNLNTALGAFVLPGVPVFTLIDSQNWIVRANFPEEELRHIRPGMVAEIQVMTDPGQTFEGVVGSIGWGVQGHDEIDVLALPYVKNKLDWVRLAQRFPVEVRVLRPEPQALFRVGASAAVTVHTQERMTSESSAAALRPASEPGSP